ncbi:MAG: glycoside hydrolase family 28 protein [Lachnospiraceae bacterium]|nr:glycoside hydrolase family 28 protein [Lachnospiraceae bacterium]
MIFNISDFGAVGNGINDDTSAIQTAIDKCHSAGGGQVLLSGNGTYRSGTILLRSNIELHIDKGTTLKASDDLNAFNLYGDQKLSNSPISIPTYENCDYDGCPSMFFLYAADCSNITISGQGTIDGNEEIFYGNITPYHIDGSFYPRVPMMFLENIKGLTIKDLTLTRSAFWTVHMIGCADVTIEELNIKNNLLLANCDGIDPDHCKNVRINNCRIESADDCIVFKNTAYGSKYGACEDITVSGCSLRSTSAAIKFGTESEDIFRNIHIQNCRIYESNRGISLQLRDKGSIEEIRFKDITIDTGYVSKKHWWGDAEPIAITAVRRKKDSKIGVIRNITFENIKCNSQNGIIIYGDTTNNIDNIIFNNVSVTLKENTEDRRTAIDLRPCEDTPSVPGSSSCFFSKNAKSIITENCSW